MRRLLFLTLFGGCMGHLSVAQQGFEIHKSGELFEKDWSGIDHLLSGGKEDYKNQADISGQQWVDLTGIVPNNPGKLGRKATSYADMPVYEPDGKHNMPVHVPDSTIRYPIRIDKPE